MKRFLSGTRFVLFLSFACLSVFLLSAMFIGGSAAKELSLIEYRKQYYKDQSHKLAYALQTHIRFERLSKDEIQLLHNFSAVYTFAFRYYAADGSTLLFDSADNRPLAAEPFDFDVPIIVEGNLIGYIKTYFDLSKHDFSYYPGQAMESSRPNAVLFAGLLILSVLLSYVMAKKLSGSIVASSKVADHIAGGIRGTRMPVTGTSEMKQLASTINALVAEFDRQEGWRKQMMQDLAHELRTPLTSLLSRIDAILDGILPATEENMHKIHTEIDRLCRLVDDLEKLSEAEGARFELNIGQVDMTQLVKDVYEGFLFMSKGKDIHFTFQKPHVPCYAEVDPDRFIQIISNLVSNAIKYTPAGGSVEMGLYPAETGIVFYCQDNGIGISKKDLPLIFNRFYRVDKSRRRKNASGGIGVGLSIAKALAEAHGGTIGVESAPGKGSKFYVNI
ncbi:cell wall metabolism sensor histidine kinase WalK [Paenibacillus alkaliterrae]|uniref:sensor histidine kinase n=1 Tax=Paenibacillus alkaliterrae TaxID=320909 RepID=UPI001F1C758A|nr:ATP-binding protein [Paenibacillus alkaliterrae]MCF2938020.1 cell wall metabolism sensor histidine kinase WalK [Paenibacillus alkaliterrae]